ncbi:hypothetical protein GCM10023195_55590 [Actinoallomurus liliacearum]|uniref:Uncharacterized protein n=1 Tax=Actinoallomurus liliacearum TaxID=1080073 RepID=A0ABP8TRI1_9ACTN
MMVLRVDRLLPTSVNLGTVGEMTPRTSSAGRERDGLDVDGAVQQSRELPGQVLVVVRVRGRVGGTEPWLQPVGGDGEDAGVKNRAYSVAYTALISRAASTRPHRLTERSSRSDVRGS